MGDLAEIIGLTISAAEEVTHHLLPIRISCISFNRFKSIIIIHKIFQLPL